MLVAAGTSKYLKNLQNPKELMNHKIFDLITFKPSGILQLAPLIMEQSLDFIVKEKEEEIIKEKENMDLL